VSSPRGLELDEHGLAAGQLIIVIRREFMGAGKGQESGGEEDDDAGDEGGGDEQEPPEVPQALEAIPIAQVQLMLQQLGFPTEGTDEELRARLLQSVLGMGMGEGDEDMGEWSEDE